MVQRLYIMKLEPLANAEHVLATVSLTDEGMISIRPADGDTDAEYWENLLAQIVGILPEAHPREFFDALPDHLDGTYVYARREAGDREEFPLGYSVGA